MPYLIAPVFNSSTSRPVRINLPQSFVLMSGEEKLYKLASRYLKNQMDESRLLFDRKVGVDSLFLFAEYPDLKVRQDQAWIEEIEQKLNLATLEGICSIPYVITAQPPLFGITYLKRSIDGKKFHFDERTEEIFLSLIWDKPELPQLASRRYALSLEKKSLEDQLLDLWIALESLFVPDGKKGEITYKLRLRMAYYFGDTFAERERVAQFVKRSYNHRSEIVHSGKVLGKALEGDVNRLRQMARAVILNTAMEGITLQDLRLRLDELIMAGESYASRYKPVFFEQVKIESTNRRKS
jgi:Apea-like HEPN